MTILNDHTPGPWLTDMDKVTNSVSIRAGVGGQMVRIAQTDGYWVRRAISQNEMMANARLISEAPNMALLLRNPKILIGEFLLSRSPEGTGVWITHLGGEGGEFSSQAVGEAIKKFYIDNF